jgi:hypothetical protein
MIQRGRPAPGAPCAARMRGVRWTQLTRLKKLDVQVGQLRLAQRAAPVAVGRGRWRALSDEREHTAARPGGGCVSRSDRGDAGSQSHRPGGRQLERAGQHRSQEQKRKPPHGRGHTQERAIFFLYRWPTPQKRRLCASCAPRLPCVRSGSPCP